MQGALGLHLMLRPSHDPWLEAILLKQTRHRSSHDYQ
jgi:hypothetical protein